MNEFFVYTVPGGEDNLKVAVDVGLRAGFVLDLDGHVGLVCIHDKCLVVVVICLPDHARPQVIVWLPHCLIDHECRDHKEGQDDCD